MSEDPSRVEAEEAGLHHEQAGARDVVHGDPDPNLFVQRAAPPAPRQVLGVIGIVVVCVAVIAVIAYFVATGTS